ncbi:NAD(P)/FAD-dependent oxidoreductase [Mycolicibacterium confluentis]|uniref:Dehydrogenase n=1 Tax=Mycolicibacterium confluentis TaxID=28047 RepID=A0A7I7XRT9_9MYCO|nr:FAD-dependent oxidoreductase [Mycolicibacterium confluentis]MCV7318827.1 FAD-dependent oxidoreductase [Mycolicibacterium confluentis]ORV23061.1 pyridine nucleotide-disulfide oxidoreductase [Mycolicibacterium confluentis]BBZ31979.1 dehydrogenase [Mycolicibacterium confluentis]
MATTTANIVVIGGGYAGVLAANRVRKNQDLRVSLVNARPHFVERIRLHQLAIGNDDAIESYDTVLGDGVRLVVDGATRIDAPARQVQLASGEVLDYDWLIYAVGSTGGAPRAVEGAAEFAFPLAEFEDATRLRARLQDVPESAPIVVVGGGLTGIEAASEFAEAGRPVTLVTDRVGPSLGTSGRKSVTKALRRHGVRILEGVTVSAVTADEVELADGARLPSAVTVWTAGFGVPSLAADSGLTVDALGRLRTDETLTSVDDDRIVAAGDAAAPSGLPLRMSCQAAMPLGAQAAETVLARVAGADAAALSQAFTGQCISLGRTFGTVQLAHTDDTPRRAYIGGRTAAFVKEQVCRFTLRGLQWEANKPGSYKWLRSDWRDDLLAAADEAVPAR